MHNGRSTMMKHLYLLRHAKSSWDSPRLADFDRPLNDRGLRAAPFIGEWMRDHAILPELWISSPAVRARQTAELVREAAGSEEPLEYEELVYEASPRTLLSVISRIPNSIGSAILVGHNPGMEGFVRFLTGQLEPMPTAALACLLLEVDAWNTIEGQCGQVEKVVRPKEEMRTRNAP